MSFDPMELTATLNFTRNLGLNYLSQSHYRVTNISVQLSRGAIDAKQNVTVVNVSFLISFSDTDII